jgi:hypothetical protein
VVVVVLVIAVELVIVVDLVIAVDLVALVVVAVYVSDCGSRPAAAMGRVAVSLVGVAPPPGEHPGERGCDSVL